MPHALDFFFLVFALNSYLSPQREVNITMKMITIINLSKFVCCYLINIAGDYTENVMQVICELWVGSRIMFSNFLCFMKWLRILINYDLVYHLHHIFSGVKLNSYVRVWKELVERKRNCLCLFAVNSNIFFLRNLFPLKTLRVKISKLKIHYLNTFCAAMCDQMQNLNAISKLIFSSSLYHCM